MRRLLLVFLACAALTVPIVAAGTATRTSQPVRSQGERFTRYTVAWTSSSGGAVSANTFTVLPGRIVSVRFVPGTSGTQPTDLYDVTLVDTSGADVIFGAGANLSNATASVVRLSPSYFQDGTRVLDLVVANAGDSKTGTVEVLVQTQ